MNEIARNIQEYVDSSGESKTALFNVFVLPALFLQKTSSSSRAKQNVELLRRRLDLWKKNDIQALLEEGRCLQKGKSPPRDRRQGTSDDARHFSELMSSGKVHEALEMLRTPNTPGSTGKGRSIAD